MAKKRKYPKGDFRNNTFGGRRWVCEPVRVINRLSPEETKDKD